MFIKVVKSVVHLGFGYRIGFTGDVPTEVGKELVKLGRAVVLPALKVEKEEEEKEVIKEVEPEVITAVVKKTRKRKVK